MGPRISAVINTFNEERNLSGALASVSSWVDEIVVVDMYSEDQTRTIAGAYGAKVYLHDRLGFVEPARAYALSKATGEWVLVLDADERVPVSLAETLRNIALSDTVDVVFIPRLNWIFGHQMRGTGWGLHQDRHPRFFRRGVMKPSDIIHASMNVQPGARVITLPGKPEMAIVHFNYRNIAHWFEKMRRYTTIEANQRYELGERYNLKWWRFAGNFFLVFWGRWWGLQGYKDGVYGVLLSLLYAHYDATWRFKLWRKAFPARFPITWGRWLKTRREVLCTRLKK
ncbi:MAG: glycosyltransferase family 2 protein [Acidithiobacillus sp.]|nr:glycosyltransferase family 2 protein [Acidithiobacillus sp.]